MKSSMFALLIAASLAAVPDSARAADPIAQPIAGTRLDIVASGEVTRIPDLAIITAAVVTKANTASAALSENSARMDRVIAALKHAGVADRDIQTSSISLNPDYRYPDNQAPQLVDYSASNSVTVRFRDIARSGRILDSLVAEGANQISGPDMTIEQPDQALDEARTKAVAAGRARAEIYARALGERVVRIVSISENEGSEMPPPRPYAQAAMVRSSASTKIEPGEQKLRVTVSMVFDLQ